MKERFRLIATSHLVLIRDSKILLLRRFNTGYEDGKYSVIAGHLDGNETFRQAMAREAREEAGIEVRPEDLEVAHVMHRNEGGERIDLFLVPRKWNGEPRNMEPDKCDDLGWFGMGNLPEDMVPYVRQAIGCILENTVYSEHGWVHKKSTM